MQRELGDDYPTTENSVSTDDGSSSVFEHLPVYISGSIKQNPNEDYGEYYKRSYRLLYYTMAYDLYKIVDDYDDFFEQYVEKYAHEEPDEMMIVSFIKYFNIPREDFEKVVSDYQQKNVNAGRDIHSEEKEIPNLDIIYTFDNEIINEYYRRE
jgi:hypothetical protein